LTWTWQPPAWVGVPFSAVPQNFSLVALSGPIRKTRKSENDEFHVPSQAIASSSALVTVGPAAGLAPAFVPSQGCGPLRSCSIAWPSVRTVPSKIVSSSPSTRRSTVTGAACAPAAASVNTTAVRAVVAPIGDFM
jgi:hypothetical protein